MSSVHVGGGGRSPGTLRLEGVPPAAGWKRFWKGISWLSQVRCSVGGAPVAAKSLDICLWGRFVKRRVKTRKMEGNGRSSRRREAPG